MPQAKDQLARAVAAAIRLDHEVRFAAASKTAPPDRAERQRVHERLDAALQAEGLRRPLPGAPLSASVKAARNHLLKTGYVFLPTGTEPGLSLAPALERKTGLKRALWGHTVRYRRVVHGKPLVPDYPTFVALRAGGGAKAPAARCADPTVFLDQSLIERRAGRGVYADLDAEGLADYLDLAQAATLLFSRRVKLEDQVLPEDLARATKAIHSRVLLTLVRYGHTATALRQVESLRGPAPGRPQALSLAAEDVWRAVSGASDPGQAAKEAWPD